MCLHALHGTHKRLLIFDNCINLQECRFFIIPASLIPVIRYDKCELSKFHININTNY